MWIMLFFMFSYLHWNLYYGPLLLGIGIFLQVYFLLRLRKPFFLAILGACLISIVAYMDSDMVLFIGQILILILLWLCKNKNEC